MVNTEIVDPSSTISFSKEGKVGSLDRNLKCTITTCKLDRKFLSGERRKILDAFKNEIQAELVNSKNDEEQRQAIAVISTTICSSIQRSFK